MSYDIYFDKSIKQFMIILYIGTGNQYLSAVLDSNLSNIFLPSNCCMKTQCNQKYGTYYFDHSDSCLVIKDNGMQVSCFYFDCYNVKYNYDYQNRNINNKLGFMQKNLIYDFVSFKPIMKNNLLKRVPIIIVTDIEFLNPPYVSLPPTLGLNKFLPEYTLDFKNLCLKTYIDNNYKYQSSRFPLITQINDQNINNLCIVDTSYYESYFPSKIYQYLKKYIVSNSNITDDSPIWQTSVKINRIESIYVPDIYLYLEGYQIIIHNYLQKDDYSNVYLLIKESEDENIILGNQVFDKIGFSNDFLYFY